MTLVEIVVITSVVIVLRWVRNCRLLCLVYLRNRLVLDRVVVVVANLGGDGGLAIGVTLFVVGGIAIVIGVLVVLLLLLVLLVAFLARLNLLFTGLAGGVGITRPLLKLALVHGVFETWVRNR